MSVFEFSFVAVHRSSGTHKDLDHTMCSMFLTFDLLGVRVAWLIPITVATSQANPPWPLATMASRSGCSDQLFHIFLQQSNNASNNQSPRCPAQHLMHVITSAEPIFVLFRCIVRDVRGRLGVINHRRAHDAAALVLARAKL